jgi:succinate dehydrogenase / fumarate reductase, membrane anchor subunit
MIRRHERSPYAGIRSQSATGEGTKHWWRERVTAVALILLTLWFFASMIAHSASDYRAVIAWLRMPSSTLMIVLLLVVLFYHAALGLQVIIEDYVHSSRKAPALAIIRLSCVVLTAMGTFAVLRIAATG